MRSQQAFFSACEANYMDMSEALRAVETWPVEEQIQFVQRVWDGIAASGRVPVLSDAQKAELDRRLEDLEENPENVVDWKSIVEHVRRKR